MVVDKVHMVIFPGDELLDDADGNFAAFRFVGLVCQMCEIASRLQPHLVHLLSNFASNGIDDNPLHAKFPIVVHSLCHFFDDITVETATETAV